MAELHTLFDRSQPGSIEGCQGDGPGAGYGHYPSYHALWHLREIGVVTDLRTFASEAWDAAEARLGATGRRTRVALIDTSVAYGHPNLKGAIATDLMIDFFSARLGTFPKPGGDDLDEVFAGAKHKAGGLPDPRVRALFEELCAHLPQERKAAAQADWQTPRRVQPATSPTFSGHGTAMAGLIGARPKRDGLKPVNTRHVGGDEGQPAAPAPDRPGFPYVGVDPFCEIVPISTSFDPDPEQLLLAMLYAWLIDADVIVLARDFPDPTMSPITHRLGVELGTAPLQDQWLLRAALPVEPSDDELALWEALRAFTLHASQTVPIVCASGNGGDRTMILPASLAAPDNGVIAVGSRAATKFQAGYVSAGLRSDGTSALTLYAPSGDGERLDSESQRIDTADPGFRPGDHGSEYLSRLGIQHPALADQEPPDETASIFATQEIISTDVPGAAGYNSSAFSRFTTPDGSILDYRSYYCRFSGTSAAAAIAAGMLSLAICAGRIESGDGVEAKKRLRGGDAPINEETATPFLEWSNLPSPS